MVRGERALGGPGLCIKKTMTSLQSSSEEFLAECEACHLETLAMSAAESRYRIPGETAAMQAAASRSQAARRVPVPTSATASAAELLLRLQKAWSRPLQPCATHAVGFLAAGSIRSCWAWASSCGDGFVQSLTGGRAGWRAPEKCHCLATS
jgi:hypothetical protein